MLRDCTVPLAGKMQVLEGLLAAILGGQSGERAVVVSNSTKTLDNVSAVCDSRNWATVRICGDVNAAKRQDIVTAFNKHNVGQVGLYCDQAKIEQSRLIISVVTALIVIVVALRACSRDLYRGFHAVPAIPTVHCFRCIMVCHMCTYKELVLCRCFSCLPRPGVQASTSSAPIASSSLTQTGTQPLTCRWLSKPDT